jgi:hypothetical protein
MSTPITHPTALADQIGAATRDARRVLTNAARILPGAIIDTTASAWLAEQADTLRAALRDGTARACQHLGPSPMLAHAAVWAPGRLVCSGCIAALRPTPAEDATCDRCRRHARRLHAGATSFGPVILAYGLCRSCAKATGLTSATADRDTSRPAEDDASRQARPDASRRVTTRAGASRQGNRRRRAT